MEKLLLSPAEAAAHLSIGRSKVYELMRLGQLRSVKIGASRRIPQAALADFIAALIEEPRGRVAAAAARIRCISMATDGEAQPRLATAPTDAVSARK
jgi:excisionase family DNA binding protein